MIKGSILKYFTAVFYCLLSYIYYISTHICMCEAIYTHTHKEDHISIVIQTQCRSYLLCDTHTMHIIYLYVSYHISYLDCDAHTMELIFPLRHTLDTMHIMYPYILSHISYIHVIHTQWRWYIHCDTHAHDAYQVSILIISHIIYPLCVCVCMCVQLL